MTYWLSIIRFVPDPARGEFINIGAIAGSDERDDWEVRPVANWTRARQIDEHGSLTAVMDFIARFQTRVALAQESLSFADEGISLEGLRALHSQMRNVVQLSAPVPVLASTAAAVVDLAFRDIVLDPEPLRFPYVKKHAALKAIRDAYQARGVTARRDARVRSGPYDTEFDYVVGNGSALQLVRCWSFQLPDQRRLSEEVKAWAWGVRALRLVGHGDVLLEKTGETLVVGQDVDVEAVFMPPTSNQVSREAYAVAMEAFADQQTSIVPVAAEDAEHVVNRAVELLDHAHRS